jgi:hypothetical protein
MAELELQRFSTFAAAFAERKPTFAVLLRIVRSALHRNRLAAKVTTEPRGWYLAESAGTEDSHGRWLAG